jgi:hypothetical protein
MSNASLIAVKATTGESLSAEEREQLTPPLLVLQR